MAIIANITLNWNTMTDTITTFLMVEIIRLA